MSDLRYVLRLAGVRPRDFIGPIIAGAVTLLTALGLAVLSGWLITRAWEMPPVLELSVAVTAVRALGISRAVFRYLDRLVSHKLALSSLTQLRATLYDAQSRAPVTSRGDAQALLVADTERVTDVIVRAIVPAGVAVVVSAVALVAAVLLQPQAAVALACGFAVTGVLVPALAVRSARSTDLVSAENAFISQLDSVLSDRVEFTAAGLTDQRAAKAARASEQASAAWVRSKRPEALAAGMQAWATGLTAVAVLWVAATAYTGNPVWLGMLIMLPLAAFESHGPLGVAAIHFDAARRAAARLRAVAEQPAPTKLQREDTRAVVAEDLATLHGDTVWNFRLAEGERMVVRGPSGSGKTQMLATVAGLQPPRAGRVTQPTGARFFAEDAWVFATAVRENLLVANPTAPDAVLEEALTAVGFEFPLDLLLADGADSLSSGPGQHRRLLLARALVSDADVLLLDEPTEHLSPDAAAGVMDMLLHQPLPGAKPDRTVIVVTHVDGPVGTEVFPRPV
ncbi:thiol reductant ABC exporter subunit CydC [Corynebacterium sp. CNCTC7651]|uniref:thiol reductant ABC exporter subunit CydC n=1 Tax=Corynebacterium sp. CNCTC7651 TaxID=2815361 RepID=UPI001F2C1683|nr:thiol reductant ABC exporter subunit CydC [Corynebacterium sp. CNCTC7651]UIZ91827.1 thiol reductant ABC exporter subunit CydC [Corynebacterium sp. CNCTC7651]